MFEVLVFVYENYWRGDACPQHEHLQRKLSAVGFEAEEIQDALAWLGGLSLNLLGLEANSAQLALQVLELGACVEIGRAHV